MKQLPKETLTAILETANVLALGVNCKKTAWFMLQSVGVKVIDNVITTPKGRQLTAQYNRSGSISFVEVV